MPVLFVYTGVDALIQGLSFFKGGVLLVSHDEHFIENSADELWVASGDGNVTPWSGTFKEYKQSLLATMKGGGH